MFQCKNVRLFICRFLKQSPVVQYSSDPCGKSSKSGSGGSSACGSGSKSGSASSSKSGSNSSSPCGSSSKTGTASSTACSCSSKTESSSSASGGKSVTASGGSKDPPPCVPCPSFYDCRKFGHNLPCDSVAPHFDTLPGIPTGIFRCTNGESLGRGADKCCLYPNPEYFSYHHMSFYDIHLCLRPCRLPSPISGRKK